MIKHIKLNETDSTQLQLKEMLKAKKESLLISARSQNKAYGRKQRAWHQGQNSLAFSFTFEANPKITLTSLELGCLLRDYLFQKFGAEIYLKWPNDILNKNFKKLGGILIESSQSTGLIAGIGLNLGKQEAPSEADSYKTGFGIIDDSIELSENDYHELPMEMIQFFNSNRLSPEEVVSKWNSYCLHLNKEVTILEDQNEFKGHFKGIGEFGEALIETDSQIKRVFSGTLLL